MSFEWDEDKRIINLAKHGIDFEGAKLIFDGVTMELVDDRVEYGEERIGTYGIANNEVLFVVYTQRGNSRRIISARKAGTYEREAYYIHVAARGADNE
jgi:uncharacterized DUF497 family protein